MSLEGLRNMAFDSILKRSPEAAFLSILNLLTKVGVTQWLKTADLKGKGVLPPDLKSRDQSLIGQPLIFLHSFSFSRPHLFSM